MMRRRLRSLSLRCEPALVALALYVAAPACSDDARPGSPSAGRGGSEDGQGGDGGGTKPVGHGGSGDTAGAGADEPGAGGKGDAGGGATGEAGAGATTGEGGSSDPYVPPVEPGVCVPQTSWGDPQPLIGISTPDADEQLLALTNDERTLIFRRDAALYRAERAHAGEAWGTPVPLTLPAGFDVDYGPALSQDALRLILVRDDRRAFAQVTRASRSEDFGTAADTTPFGAINSEAGYQYYDFGSPLMAPNDQTLYYLGLYGGAFVFTCARSDDSWQAGVALFDAASSAEDAPRLPLGLSHDERTLFVFDEEAGHVISLWRDAIDAPFKPGPELPGRLTASPTASCQGLYTTRTLGDSLDIVLESPL